MADLGVLLANREKLKAQRHLKHVQASTSDFRKGNVIMK